jgi:hypothetical protein
MPTSPGLIEARAFHHSGTSSASSTQQRRLLLSSHGPTACKKVLKAIENVYSAVLRLQRNQPARSGEYSGGNEKEAFENWCVLREGASEGIDMESFVTLY